MVDVAAFDFSWSDVDGLEAIEGENENWRSGTGLQWSGVELVSLSAAFAGIVSLNGISRQIRGERGVDVFQEHRLVAVLMIDFDGEFQGLVFYVDGLMYVAAMGTTVFAMHFAGTEGRQRRRAIGV